MGKFSVILAAAGKSSRFRAQQKKKPFARLGERAVWLHSAEKFLNRDDVVQLIVAVAKEDRQEFMDQFGPNVLIMGIDVVTGGEERSDTIRNALEAVSSEAGFVAVHDAARPCIATEWIDEVFRAGEKTGAAILAAPVTATVKRVSGRNLVEQTVDRKNLWLAQTPQVFRREILEQAFAKHRDLKATDEAQLVEAAGHQVTVVPCSEMNMKITRPEDLKLARAILNLLPKPKLDAPLHPFADDNLWR